MLPDRRREETGSLLAASGPLVERIHLVVMRRHRHATATLSRRHPERARDSQPCPGREEMRRTGRHPDLLRAGTAVLLGADAGIPAGTVVYRSNPASPRSGDSGVDAALVRTTLAASLRAADGCRSCTRRFREQPIGACRTCLPALRRDVPRRAYSRRTQNVVLRIRAGWFPGG